MNHTSLHHATAGLAALAAFGMSSPAAALSITDITVSNLSSANEASVNANSSRFREFHAANVSTSTISGDINQQSFSNHFAWMSALRVNQPDGPDYALISRHRVGYEITFTVEDPLNQGYEINVAHTLRGALDVERVEPKYASAHSGPMIGRFIDGNCDPTTPTPPASCNRTGLSVFGIGMLTVGATDPQPVQNKLGQRDNEYTSVAYAGTHSFTVQFNSSPSPATSFVFGNFGGGEVNARFGLAPTLAGITNGGYPGSDGTPAAKMGHFVTITVSASNEAVPDADLDGISDSIDNCPLIQNADQADGDGDGVGDACDNCIDVANPAQTDANGNGIGDLCENTPPDCSAAIASETSLWPANHKMREISISGISDADGDVITISVDGVSQDEPTGRAADARLLGGGNLELRAERDGRGDGRVYVIGFTADDGNGGSCQGAVSVGVAHDRRGSAAADSGQVFNSL